MFARKLFHFTRQMLLENIGLVQHCSSEYSPQDQMQPHTDVKYPWSAPNLKPDVPQSSASSNGPPPFDFAPDRMFVMVFHCLYSFLFCPCGILACLKSLCVCYTFGSSGLYLLSLLLHERHGSGHTS